MKKNMAIQTFILVNIIIIAIFTAACGGSAKTLSPPV
jgi:hypothetical protein